jgi:hypothetical protein
MFSESCGSWICLIDLLPALAANNVVINFASLHMTFKGNTIGPIINPSCICLEWVYAGARTGVGLGGLAPAKLKVSPPKQASV